MRRKRGLISEDEEDCGTKLKESFECYRNELSILSNALKTHRANALSAEARVLHQHEAACDLAKLAGLQSAGVICEIMNDDGTMARRDDLIKFGQENDIKIGTIADLIDYRLSMDATVESVLEKNVENEFGEFKLNVWRDKIRDEYHFSLLKGDLKSVKSPLVRVQTQSILQLSLIHI